MFQINIVKKYYLLNKESIMWCFFVLYNFEQVPLNGSEKAHTRYIMVHDVY